MKNSKGFFISEAQRQHLNLAPKAMAIIETDMIRFNNDYTKSNRSGFMNTIIQNFYNQFPLSENIVLKEVHTIKKAIQSNDFSHKLAETIIEKFTEEMMKNTINSYINNVKYGEMFKLKLNSENVKLLSTISEVKYFEKYAPRSGLGFYLKSLLESYANLPKERREEIYLAQHFERIHSAISNEETITLTKQDHIKIRPISIVLAKNKHHHEVRYFSNIDDQRKSFSPGSISLKDLIESGPIFKQGEDSSWWQELKKIYFPDEGLFESSREKLRIIVRFTENGLERFLREEDDIEIIGIPDAKDKYVYTFEATEPEAFYQLFKFGPQAQILSPSYIQKNFKLLYQAAVNKYDKLERKEGK
jgi:hypothetical protein